MATKSIIPKTVAPQLTQTLFGKQYQVDDFTNITPRILENATRLLHEQTWNPLYFVSERIRAFFKDKSPDLGGSHKFDEFKFDSPVVTTEQNFDSLLVPKNHVSRRKADSYYVNSNHLFRSHTSAHQSQCLLDGSKAFISIADCYRRDEIDRSHFPTFHQCEVFKLYNHKDIGCSSIYQNLNGKPGDDTESKQGLYLQEASSFTEGKLKSTIEQFVREFFNNPNLHTRWVSAYFPFTHPSFELEILWKDKWLEVLGCGVVRDEILKAANITDHIGFAAGFGLERFAMLKYQIPDIRLFWTKDTGFRHQFEGKSAFDEITFTPFSNCPQCINDLSFWLPTQHDQGSDSSGAQLSLMFDSNDFYDTCRTVAGDLIEQVKLVDEFKHPKRKRISLCYRIVYRATDRVLTKDEVNEIHARIGQKCVEQFQVELR